MYGKSFESMFEGSMVGAGINVFAVWSYIITKCRRGVLEINPKLLAFTLGGKESDIIEALEYLQKPDPDSRSKELEGRRLVKEGQFQYRVVNWEHYDKIKGEIDRREYNREKQQEYRERSKTIQPNDPESELAEQIYQAYPRKEARPKAISAIKTAMGKIDHQKLLEATQKFADSRAGQDPKFTPMPATWFNQERFNDDPASWMAQPFSAQKPAAPKFGFYQP